MSILLLMAFWITFYFLAGEVIIWMKACVFIGLEGVADEGGNRVVRTAFKRDVAELTMTKILRKAQPEVLPAVQRIAGV